MLFLYVVGALMVAVLVVCFCALVWSAVSIWEWWRENRIRRSRATRTLPPAPAPARDRSKSLSVKDIRARMRHDAPMTPFTVAQSKTEYLAHRRCRLDRCPRKRAVLRTAVLAGLMTTRTRAANERTPHERPRTVQRRARTPRVPTARDHLAAA